MLLVENKSKDGLSCGLKAVSWGRARSIYVDLRPTAGPCAGHRFCVYFSQLSLSQAPLVFLPIKWTSVLSSGGQQGAHPTGFHLGTQLKTPVAPSHEIIPPSPVFLLRAS